MIRTGLRATVTLALIVGLGCRHPATVMPQAPDDPLHPELIAEARDMFTQECAPCHGSDARGSGPEAAALRLPPSDLTHLTVRHGGVFPRDYFQQVVSGEVDVPAHGPRDMPVWRRRFGGSESGPAAVAALYAQRRLDLLAAYVESLQRGVPVQR